MHRSETQGGHVVKTTTTLLLGGVLALGVALLLLVLGAVAISNEILGKEMSTQITVIACVIGCLVGGRFSCRVCRTGRLLMGAATGAVCFLLILSIGLLSGNVEPGTQWFVELAACLCGGGVAGVLRKRRKKKKSPAKRSK